jgi:hypothetical protein
MFLEIFYEKREHLKRYAQIIADVEQAVLNDTLSMHQLAQVVEEVKNDPYLLETSIMQLEKDEAPSTYVGAILEVLITRNLPIVLGRVHLIDEKTDEIMAVDELRAEYRQWCNSGLVRRLKHFERQEQMREFPAPTPNRLIKFLHTYFANPFVKPTLEQDSGITSFAPKNHWMTA